MEVVLLLEYHQFFIKAFQDVSQENFSGIQEHSKYDVFLFF